MTIALRRAGAIAALLLCCMPAPARAQADWLLVPFMGVKFGGSTSIVDLELAAGETTFNVGAATSLLSQGIFGVEVEFSYIPGYFERGQRELVTSSYVVDLTGSLIITVPPSVTREGLRPYAVAGAGVIHAEASDILDVFRIRRSVPALVLGGGAMGFLTDRTGVRFDVRYLRSLSVDDEQLVAIGRRISYWRGTIGIMRRF